MKRFALGAFVAAVVGFTAGFNWMGGWAVVKVNKIPDGWVVGKPLQLSWQVRQHAVDPLYGLKPVLEARSGARTIQGTTWEFQEQGERGYRGRITFPDPGEWQVTIHSGFGRSKAVLVPWRVVRSEKDVPVFSEAERGRRLFAAQGCVSCHVHRDVAIYGELKNFGPDLSERKFPATYLASFLKDPSIKPPTNGKRMPDLDMKEKDIITLIAFINAERRVTKR